MPFLQQTQKFAHRFIEIDIWGWIPYTAVFLVFFQKYVYNDWNFLIFLGVLMLVDLITGILKSVKKSGWSSIQSKGIRDTGIKLIEYGAFLITIHVLVAFQVDGKPLGWLSYGDELGYSFLIVVEAKSIFENLQATNPDLNLKPLIDKLTSLWKK